MLPYSIKFVFKLDFELDTVWVFFCYRKKEKTKILL